LNYSKQYYTQAYYYGMDVQNFIPTCCTVT